MNDNRQRNSAPVITEWRKFTFRSERAATETTFRAGIDMRGNIWLDLGDVRNVVFYESEAALNLDKFFEFVNRLPETQFRTVLLPDSDLQKYYYDITAITPGGLCRVFQQLNKHQPGQVSKAVDYVWDWLIQVVYSELSELAAKQREVKQRAVKAQPPQCLGLPDLDVPDDEEIEAVENAMRRKSEPLRCKLVKQPESRRDNTVSILKFSEIMQFNGLKISPSMLHDYFKRCGWLCKKEHDMPTSFALNTGLFTIVSTKTVRPRAELTIKGQWYFLRLFATLKATAFDYAYDEYVAKYGVDLEEVSERLERRSKKAIRTRLKAAADIVTHFLNIIGIGKGAE